MLELLNDPERARKIAIAGQNLVEDRFTVDRMVDETITLYNDAAPIVSDSINRLE
jgi:glycosyltransferase involved in cell wall biosynthesis